MSAAFTHRLVTAATVVVAVAGCGGSATVGTDEVAPGHRTMRDVDVPFTFEYPAGFREATEDSVAAADALVVVGPAANSYLAVRLNGMTELSPDALARQARRALGDSVLDAARETHSGIEMVAITVADTGGEALGLRSTIYGFSLGGRTWLLECHAARTDRETIASACGQALRTLTPGTSTAAAPSISATVGDDGALEVTGTHWPPSVPVTVLLGPPRSEATPAASATTGQDGTFAATARLPGNAGAGQLIVLACRRDCRVKATATLAPGGA